MEDEIAKRIANVLDEIIIKMLNENGYKTPEIITSDYINELKSRLKKDDKYIDIIAGFDTETNTHFAIPFLNRISNPLSEDYIAEIIEKWKKQKK